MPYVEVWVDETECCGGCEKARDLRNRRDCAFSFLLKGQVNEAMDVLTKGKVPPDFVLDDNLRAKYVAWSKGDLEGFDGPA